MYDELEKQLRYCADSDNYCSECKYRGGSSDGSKICLDLLMLEAADAIEERDRYALTLQHEMMVEAESHMAQVERLNKQIEELSERVEELEAAQEISPEAQHFVDTKADSIIDGLQDLLASVKERPRWVSVTERLPSPMRAVLVWTPYKHNIFMAYLHGNKWYVWGPDDSCCHNWPEYHAITHWLSLPPEPPKEE